MMKPYESYKKTNVPWAKEVPSHWDIIRNMNVFSGINCKNEDESSNLLSVSQYTGVTEKKNRINKIGMHDAETLIGYKIVKINNLVMNIMLAWNGSLGVSKYDGVVSPAYSVFSSNENYNPWYYHYLLRCPHLTNYFKAYSTGVVESRLRLYPDKFFLLFSLVPTREEQDQIVRYLDWQLSKINKLIKAKKKQIALLNEQKQAIINKAVTKGLDDTVPMKDSKIEWIGQIPQYWKVIKTKHLFYEVNETGYPDLPYLSITKDMGVVLQSMTGRKNRVSDNLNMYKRILPGDIGYNLMNAFIGSLGASEYEGIISPAYAVCRPKVNMNVWYYHHLYKTKLYMQEFDNNSYGIMIERNRLYFDNFKEIFSICPPVLEQNRIVEHINIISEKINKIITRTEREIGLINEYKISLISSVVTGKIDIGDIEIPDFEIEEEQPEDDETENTDDTEGMEVDY